MMQPVDAPTRSQAVRVLGTVAGGLLGIAAAWLLLVSLAVYAVTGICWEDTCVDRPGPFGGPVGAAAPFALVALGLLTGACYVLMRGRRSLTRALTVAVPSSIAFMAGFWLVAEAAEERGWVVDVVGAPAAAVWLAGTIAATRRAGRLHRNPPRLTDGTRPRAPTFTA